MSAMEAFIADMEQLGLQPRVETELVLYVIEPVDGAYAGANVDTGVAAGELTRWPQVPPHWIHLPSGIVFPRTNSRPSPRAEWTMHSRQISRWGQDAKPAVGWAGHVRAVLGEATS